MFFVVTLHVCAANETRPNAAPVTLSTAKIHKCKWQQIMNSFLVLIISSKSVSIHIIFRWQQVMLARITINTIYHYRH